MIIKSIIPGRLRIIERRIKKRHKLSTIIELSLMQISGIKNVRINPVNGSVKVIYNIKKIDYKQVISDIKKYIKSNDIDFNKEIYRDYIEEKKNLAHASNNLIIFGASYLLIKFKKYFFGNFYFAGSLPVLIIAALVTIISDYPFLNRIKKQLNNKVERFFVYLGLFLAFLREGDLTLFLLVTKSLTEAFNAYSGLQVQKQFIKNCSIGMQVKKVDSTGKIINLPVSAIDAGNEIMVSENNVIRFDGYIIEGQALINHVYYQGRCVIEQFNKGDYVKRGMFLVKGKVRIKVMDRIEYSPKDDLEIGQMAIYSKAKYYQEKQLTVATLLAFFGFIVTGNIITPISVYLVMGPSAVEFAVKSGLAIYLKKLRDRGIILRNANKLEKIRDVDIIVFDKTGTLSSDVLSVNKIIIRDDSYSREELKYLFRCCEKGILHPIATSVENEGGKEIKEDDIENKEYISGQGVRAVINGKQVLVGNEILMHRANITLNDSNENIRGIKIFIAVEGKLVGEIVLAEVINNTALSMSKKLDDLKIERAIISGDEKESIKYLADTLGINNYQGNMSYSDKEKYIKRLKNEYDSVIMVGDGINDAGAMREADLSITFKRESINLEKVWENADCILREDNLMLVADLVLLSRSTGRQIILSNNLCRTNNFIFGLLTVSGYYNPFQAKAINTLNSIMAFLCNLPIVKLDRLIRLS